MRSTVFFVLMIPPQSITTPSDTLFPHTTLFRAIGAVAADRRQSRWRLPVRPSRTADLLPSGRRLHRDTIPVSGSSEPRDRRRCAGCRSGSRGERSEEHTSELQSLMRSSSALFCLNKKLNTYILHTIIE